MGATIDFWGFFPFGAWRQLKAKAITVFGFAAPFFNMNRTVLIDENTPKNVTTDILVPDINSSCISNWAG